MSDLVDFIAANREALLEQWTLRLKRELVEGVPPPEAQLRDHIPFLLNELIVAMTEGRLPTRSPNAEEHGRQRYRLGFDLETVVREYGLLRDVIFELVESSQAPITLAEARLLTGFLTEAVAEGVAEHQRQQMSAREAIERRRVAAHELERDLLMSAPVAIAILEGPAHVFVLANEGYRKLVNGRDVIGKPLLEALPDLVGQGFDTLLDRVMQTGGSVVGTEVPIVLEHHRPGEALYLNFVYTAKRDAHGIVDGVMVTGWDVTEMVVARRRVEQLAGEARAKQQQLSTVTNALPFLISYFDTNEVYRLVNVAYEDWFGVPRDQVLGKTLRDLVGEDAYAYLKPTIDRGLSGEHFSIERHAVPYRHGGTRDIQVTYAPQRDDAGVVVGVVALVDDITKRRQLEREREHLEERERQRSDFERQLIGIVSHDLRNPLNVVLLGTELMLESKLDEQIVKQVARIQGAAERANRLVRDLLDFTQARLGGGIRIEPVPANLHELVRSMVEEAQASTPARTIEVVCHGDGNGVWDPDRIAQVFQNLVGNAIKYSAADGKIRVTSDASANLVRVAVHNDGLAIAATKLSSLFEPYERGTASPDGIGRSVGLGLYIVKQIVDAHGGTVTATSSEDEGTSFIVDLPRICVAN